MPNRTTEVRTADDVIAGRVRGARLASVLVVLGAVAACGGDDSAAGNGVCLLVRTDMAVPAEMNQVEVAVTASGTTIPLFQDSMVFLGFTTDDLPLSVCAGPDVPASSWQVALPADYEWIVFRASGVLGTRVVAERWQVSRLDGAFHEVAVDLRAACIGVPCAAGNECVDGACRAAPRPDGWVAECGDDVPDAPEECDEGERNSDLGPDACRTDCRLPRCGDGVIDTGEQCDDGNTAPGDGCGATCQAEAAG